MKRTILLIVTSCAVALAFMVPTQAEARFRKAPDLATALTKLSGGAELDSRGRDYDIIVQTVIALEGLGGDPDLGGATLLDVLTDPNARVTVFVPRDRAFYKLAKLLGWDGNGGDAGALTTLTDTFSLETIRDVVKYHVVPERLGVFSVLFRNSFDTVLPGATFEREGLRLVDNDPDIADPYLTLPLQIRGGRSLAHTITRVLIPVDL